MSRRYAGLGHWKGLLSHFSDMTGQPFEYYRGAAGDDYPKAASMIAAAFYDKWWNDPAFADSVKKWRDSVTSTASPLKYEVAKYTRDAIDGLTVEADLAAEFDLLKAAVIDGVITTNFRSTLGVGVPGLPSVCWTGRAAVSDTGGSPRSTTSTGARRVRSRWS